MAEVVCVHVPPSPPPNTRPHARTFLPRYEAFEAKFPFLCTASVKANSFKK
jgi:hypothetical protein